MTLVCSCRSIGTPDKNCLARLRLRLRSRPRPRPRPKSAFFGLGAATDWPRAVCWPLAPWLCTESARGQLFTALALAPTVGHKVGAPAPTLWPSGEGLERREKHTAPASATLCRLINHFPFHYLYIARPSGKTEAASLRGIATASAVGRNGIPFLSPDTNSPSSTTFSSQQKRQQQPTN